MPENPKLLIVHHSQTGSTRRMAGAVIDGARSAEVSGVDVRDLDALEADAGDVLWANALIIGTPENFGYMSGATKYFLDRIYYPCLGKTEGMPYAMFVSAGNDGSGAVSSIRRIVAGLSLREVQEPVIATGAVEQRHLDACAELGMTLAAGLELGVI